LGRSVAGSIIVEGESMDTVIGEVAHAFAIWAIKEWIVASVSILIFGLVHFATRRNFVLLTVLDMEIAIIR
jgi:hypothetical protein